MEYKENKGSEWRKWDLHVHTPESGLANSFGADWDQYVVSLFRTAVQHEVAVIGITDYFSIDGYKTLKNNYLNNDPKLNELFDNDSDFIRKVKEICILPNIEFRLHNLVDNNRINYHVIFSDNVSIRDIEENFLHEIDFLYEQEPYSTGERRKLKKDNISILGQKIKSEQSSFKGSDFEVGCTVAVVDDQQIKKILGNKKSIFKNNYLICIPVDEDLSSIRWNGQGHAVRKGYYQQCNAFFATNTKTIDFGLGKFHATKEEFINEFKSLKPSIYGCDAHSCKQIENWLGQNVTVFNPQKTSQIDCQKHILWIKADPSFDGLRQILFEPESRVKIQSSKPEIKSDRMVISAVEFESEDSLMGNQKILFNDNLNSIIGGKSSGKSLLLHSIADAIDPEQVERISYALKFEGYRSAFNYNLKVYWKNGDTDMLSSKDNKSHKITYIPQLYINYLAERNNKNDLNSLIINILNQNDEFRTFYNAQKEKISNLSNDIAGLLLNLFDNRTRAIALNKKLKEIGYEDAIVKSIKDFEKRIDDLKKEALLSSEESTKHTELTKKVEGLESQKKGLLVQIEVTRKIQNELNAQKIKLCGEPSDTLNPLKGSLETILDNYINLPSQILALKELVSIGLDKIQEDLNSKITSFKFEEQISAIEKEVKTITTSLQPILLKLKNQTEISKLQEQYKKEIERLEVSKLTKKQFDTALKDYRDIQNKISELLKARHEIYKSIQNKINSDHNRIHDDISLNAILKFDRSKFVFYQQVNKARVDSNHNFNAIFREKGVVDYAQIPELFSQIKGINKDSNLKVESDKDTALYPLNQNIDLEDIYKGLIEDFFELDFEVKYRNDELLNMSPGKKGTVLLILFLQISSAEYPILIDQPEDNLDNRTIYDLLCQMIRTKKIERQIIIVSHNANLVVATDSENVIVANQEGQATHTTKNLHRFEYVNGALEFSFPKNEEISGILFQQGIKEHVCDILEGGDEAFKHRERKYFYYN